MEFIFLNTKGTFQNDTSLFVSYGVFDHAYEIIWFWHTGNHYLFLMYILFLNFDMPICFNPQHFGPKATLSVLLRTCFDFSACITFSWYSLLWFELLMLQSFITYMFIIFLYLNNKKTSMPSDIILTNLVSALQWVGWLKQD